MTLVTAQTIAIPTPSPATPANPASQPERVASLFLETEVGYIGELPLLRDLAVDKA
ncbi:hypothetical protein [Paraburkholderia acidisoli]|uniref:Uncharacterized protein n=1 Tax=Paraburkholderia acidisoli TaxID=2571748 RepID=A0A7Z2JIZ4_9BURK|nr:hypothetical protein [Paraburkholderia acidisoli]QGZ65678.1 hypothetical protein FAZ98_28495 [Paraburkholderia acidisoli]